jgi:hypothetical protein
MGLTLAPRLWVTMFLFSTPPLPWLAPNIQCGMDFHLGVEGSNSNGNGDEIYKEGNMMKIIERLQKVVQTHRADNKKLMKSREQQGEFNIKLILSLKRIENKLDKESESSKSGSHSSPDEKRKSRSFGRHHHHSQGHSKRRAHSS